MKEIKKIRIQLPTTIINTHAHGRDMEEEYKTTAEQVLRESLLGNISISFFMPNTKPAITDLDVLKNYLYIIEKAKDVLNITSKQFVYFGVTEDNLAECSKALEYPEVIGLKGYPLGPKGFVTTGTCGFRNNTTMFEAMKMASQKNRAIAFHCDDPQVIEREGNSIWAEVSYVKKVIEIVQMVPDVKIVICHVSCQRSAELILEAQEEGLNIAIEISPRNLFFSNEAWTQNPKIHKNFYHCYNVLRSWQDVLFLRHLISDENNRMILIGSDDACHTEEEKLLKRLGGMPGNMEMVPAIVTLAYADKSVINLDSFRIPSNEIFDISNKQVARLLSHNAADFFGIDIDRDTEEYTLEERVVDYDYNNGKVVNPWKGTELLFPRRKK